MSEKSVIFTCDGRIHHEIPRYDTSHGTATNIRLPQSEAAAAPAASDTLCGSLKDDNKRH